MRQLQSLLFWKKRFFIIGVTTGVVLSLVVMPFLEDCHNSNIDLEDNWYSLIVNNDYNPVIRLNVENKNDSYYEKRDMKRHNKVVLRPRFYTTELEVKDDLLVCVLLSTNTSKANHLFNKTIAEYSDKVLYFSEKLFTTPDSGFADGFDSMVFLSKETNTDSQKVPTLKSKPKYLKILNYLFKTKTVHNFNFIFIISDRTYVNENNLFKFLNNFTVSQYIFASPLTSNKDNLKSNTNDILESGVLFSCSLLLKCNLDIRCLNEFKNRFPNPTQSTFISYQINSDFNINSEQLILNKDLFYKSLTIYPVYDIYTHYRLHLILCQNFIFDSLNELSVLESQIKDINEEKNVRNVRNVKNVKNVWPLGVEHSHKPTNRFEVIRWSYFNESHVLMPNDFDVSLPLNMNEMLEIAQIKTECIKWIRNKYNNVVNEDQLKIINFYKRFDAIRGLEYLVDFRLKAFPDIKRLQLIKPLNKIELITGVPYVTENVRIVMVLLIRSHEEIQSAASFLVQYTNVCLKKANHQTVLVLILINHLNQENDEYIAIKEDASQLQNKYKNSGAKIAWISINSANDKVPTELAYFDILSRKLSLSFTDSLILNCRPNMIISLDYLNRVRLNTIQGNQIFFPIPFVEYRLRSQVKPLKNFDVRKDNGYFDTTDYNHQSFYLSDYIKARKAIQHYLPIVRSDQFLKRSVYYDSELDLFHLFVEYNSVLKSDSKSKALFIMRAIEPELKLKHESFSYDCFEYEKNKLKNKKSKLNCQKRNLIGLGSKRQLAALIIDDNRRDDNNGQEIVDEENSNVF